MLVCCSWTVDRPLDAWPGPAFQKLLMSDFWMHLFLNSGAAAATAVGWGLVGRGPRALRVRESRQSGRLGGGAPRVRHHYRNEQTVGRAEITAAPSHAHKLLRPQRSRWASLSLAFDSVIRHLVQRADMIVAVYGRKPRHGLQEVHG